MKPTPPVDSLILTLRGQKVTLDANLAGLYGVENKRLNEQVKRNVGRFPEDFMFQLSKEEWANLKSQIATSSLEATNRSQSVTGSHGGRRTRPFVFTEHGALMAANVLNSPQAVKMSVYVVRAFIKQREVLLAHSDVLKRLAQIDASLLQHDDALRIIWRKLQPLLGPPPTSPKREIGFHQP